MALSQREDIPTRVVLVDDHTLFAQALEVILRAHGCEVVRVQLPDQVLTTSQLVRLCLDPAPGVVLLDLDLGAHGDATRLIGPIDQAGTSVVVITAETSEARWGKCLDLGARRVLSKSLPLGDIIATLRRLANGLPIISPQERERLLEAWRAEQIRHRRERALLETLTPREQEVLAGLMRGRQVRDIARHGVVSEATVRTQVKSILHKLQVSSQLAAVGLASRAEWTPEVPAQR